MKSIQNFTVAVLLLVASLTGESALSQPYNEELCGPMPWPQHYGPYDYRTHSAQLQVVFNAHFTPKVENVIGGQTSITPGGDTTYTLLSAPNYPRALLAMTKLGQKEKTSKPQGSLFTVDCWYQRALRFRPDDHVARMLYVTFLIGEKRRDDALRQLNYLQETTKQDDPFTQYNLGMLYFDLGEYDSALAQAHKTQRLGSLPPGLKDKLHGANKWKEAADTDSTAKPAESSSAVPAAPARSP